MLLVFSACQRNNAGDQAGKNQNAPDTVQVSPHPVQDSDNSALGREEAPDSVTALAVLETYYDAINAKDYPRAYSLWASNGEASGKTLAQFSAGFAKTEAVRLMAGPPGPIGAAAGSRYIDIPVAIQAKLSDGTEQHFTGTYTLRRSVVDGATSEQSQWRIYKAHVVQKGN